MFSCLERRLSSTGGQEEQHFLIVGFLIEAVGFSVSLDESGKRHSPVDIRRSSDVEGNGWIKL
ncbi:hypothetical protein J6590_034727 [Homalodisca vitripennis]|nr:hypothetical protein J6590_034727 [Homalodisca vitripennis]